MLSGLWISFLCPLIWSLSYLVRNSVDLQMLYYSIISTLFNFKVNNMTHLFLLPMTIY